MFVNGHSALECIFDSFGLGEDGRTEVITTPFTFVSTTNAIVRSGLTPVFCDIRATDYTIDPEKIESLITDKTCAIVPVHVYGNVCNDDKICALAEKYNLKVIYDAAHAFGVKKNGVSVSKFGDASMFSFHATKVFNTIEGGAIVYKLPELTGKLAQWRNFGITGPETCEYIGGNAKMNEFCAAMGLCNLRHLDSEISKRKKVAERYFDNLCSCEGVKLCIPPSNVDHNYSYLPIEIVPGKFCGTRDEIFDRLATKGIGARKYFYPIVSDYACYRNDFNSSLTPVAKAVSENILTLPMYADLSLENVDYICSIVLNK